MTAAEDSSSSEKVQSQLKGHLNGLYSGFATIIKSTAQIDSKDDVNRAPFVIEKAIHNIIFIKHHMKRQDEFDAVRDSVTTDQAFLILGDDLIVGWDVCISTVHVTLFSGGSRLGHCGHGPGPPLPLGFLYRGWSRQHLYPDALSLHVRQPHPHRHSLLGNRTDRFHDI